MCILYQSLGQILVSLWDQKGLFQLNALLANLFPVFTNSVYDHAPIMVAKKVRFWVHK